jgi:hypothetical protein
LTVTVCTTLPPRVEFAVQLNVVLEQLAEYDEPSLHSQPQDAVKFDKFGALCWAAFVMPVVSVGYCDPYSAPA